MITMHPGEYLATCYLEPLELTQTALAKQLRVSKSAISRLVSADADLSAEMAVRLSYIFPLSAEAWMAMQTQYSLNLAKQSLQRADFAPLLQEPLQESLIEPA